MRDVVVIGAGPAGSITARRLAERGHDVLLLEDHDGVGTPVHCTGLLGADAFQEFQLPRDVILGEASGARFWGASGRSVPVGSDRVRATIIDRGALDRRLAGDARSAGAELRLSTRVESLDVETDRVVLRSPSLESPVSARTCVLACGANYRFHRQLGLGLPDVFLQSAQIETAFASMPDVEVRFGREVAPAGFAWLVPFTRGNLHYARIGLMTEAHSRQRFQALAASLAVRAGLPRDAVGEPRLKMLPLGPVAKTYSDRVLAVGDAAGLVKPTTGGGIYYGLLSGALAADVLDEGLRRNKLGSAHLRRYETLWRKRLGQEIRVGLAFRRIASRLNDDAIDALIDVARVNGVVPLIQETASFNWHRKAALALLAHPSFRKIVFKSWTRVPDPL